MSVGDLLKYYVLSLTQARWQTVLDGLKRAKFLVVDKASDKVYIGFPARVGIVDAADGLAAFIRKLLALVAAAAK